jgi:predicted ATP-grasp superfamily ATP-dependent carboligase
LLPIRVFWAPPGPKADAALRRYWARAYEVAAEILARQARQQPVPSTTEDTEKPKEQRP